MELFNAIHCTYKTRYQCFLLSIKKFHLDNDRNNYFKYIYAFKLVQNPKR